MSGTSESATHLQFPDPLDVRALHRPDHEFARELLFRLVLALLCVCQRDKLELAGAVLEGEERERSERVPNGRDRVAAEAEGARRVAGGLEGHSERRLGWREGLQGQERGTEVEHDRVNVG